MRSFLRTMGEPLFPYETLLWVARIVLLDQRGAAHHGRRSAHPHELGRAAAGIRDQAVDCHLVCGPDHALERRDPGPVRRLPLAAPDGRGGRLSARSVSNTSRSTTTSWPAFSVWYVSLFYILAMAALCLHLDHGIWSMLQTLGWNNARISPALRILSRVVAVVVFAGFISVPVAVLAGWLR